MTGRRGDAAFGAARTGTVALTRRRRERHAWGWTEAPWQSRPALPSPPRSCSAITSSLVLDEVLASIAHRTCEVLELWECDIYGWVAPQEEAACLAVWALEPEPGDEDWVGGRLRLTEHPTFRRVLHEGRLLAAYLADPGLPAADRARMEAWGERSCLLVPLIFKGEVIGCLQLIEKRHTRLFSERDRQLATTLAALAAVAIQNARLYGELEALAITDGVTALFNHRHFHERLAAEVARANRYGLALSLLLIDIDGFKDYNDRYGHPAGDALLRALGALLIEQTRTDIDIVARYGGDEFAVILPSTGGEGAGSAGERLRDAIEQQRLAVAERADVADVAGPVREHDAADAAGSPATTTPATPPWPPPNASGTASKASISARASRCRS